MTDNPTMTGSPAAEPEPDRRAEFVEALAKGLSVIEAFSEERPAMTLSDVARHTGMSPATARRSLHTLVALGYVRLVDRRFVLSARVLTLGAAYLKAANIEELVQPELRRIVGRFGDAASVAVLEDTDILYIAHYSEQRAARMVAGVGVTYPAYATSLGRVLLSGLAPAELDAFLARINPRALTDRTVTDKDRLRAIVEETRRQTFAIAVDELDYGITALAVPVKDAAGRVMAALNSSGYSGRLDAATMVAERLEGLHESAAAISQAIRRHPALAASIRR
jgi:IclR family pca regulon transcriptional regulator